MLSLATGVRLYGDSVSDRSYAGPYAWDAVDRHSAVSAPAYGAENSTDLASLASPAKHPYPMGHERGCDRFPLLSGQGAAIEVYRDLRYVFFLSQHRVVQDPHRLHLWGFYYIWPWYRG